MSHQLRGFFKKITGDSYSYDALAKQPVIDAENKLNLFKDVTAISLTAFEAYIKSMSKLIDSTLAEKLAECQDIFNKYEAKGELLNPNIAHVMGIVFGKMSEVQKEMAYEVSELSRSIEKYVLKPLNDYQKEVTAVKENRKELKEAYDKIEQCRQLLDKAKRDVDNAQKSGYSSSQAGRISLMGSSDSNKRTNDVYKLEEKVTRIEKELDDATAIANEKYDKYTEGLYKRVAEECELTNYYLEYLKLQKQYHKQAYKRLDAIIPEVKNSLASYSKKPAFGCPLNEYVYMSNSMMSRGNENSAQQQNQHGQQHISPVIRKLVDSMCKQNAFNEEGIFRVAGSRIKMNCLLYAINAGYIDYLDTNNDFDIHCLAGVLKQYIRELPDSLLCNELYDDWIVAINSSPQAKKIEAFKEVLKKLPKANYDNIRYLIKFLAKIVDNAEKTKMNSQNMGICFGVSLLSNNSAISNGNTNSNSVNSMVLSPPSSTISNSIANLNAGAHDNISISSMSSSVKSIDMATATNVFDFLLNNHLDLFPSDNGGPFNNSISSSRPPANNANSSFSANNSHNNNSSSNNNNNNNSINNKSLNSPESSTPPVVSKITSNGGVDSDVYHHSSNHPHHHQQHTASVSSSHHNPHNRYSVMINDRKFMESYGVEPTAASSVNLNHKSSFNAGTNSASIFSNGAQSNSPNMLSASISTSTLAISNGMQNSQISNLNRHIKKNSLDSRFVDSTSELTASNTSLSSNKTTQSNQQDQNSGSMSPKLRDKKKHAPAPPPAVTTRTINTNNNPNESQVFSSPLNNSSFLNNTPDSNNPNYGLSTIINITNSSISRSLNDSNGIQPSSPSIKTTNEMATSFILEKPNQPPPSVPIRPPPIGFNVALLEDMSIDASKMTFMNELSSSSLSSSAATAATTSSVNAAAAAASSTSNSTPIGHQANTTANNQNNNNVSSSIASSSILSTSMSSTSSSSQEMLNNNNANSPNNTPTISSNTNNILNNSNSNNIKSKPAVPPKRLHGNNITAQINKFEQIKNGSTSDEHFLVGESEPGASPKAPSEITSL